MIKTIKAIFDISNANNVDLGVGYSMYATNRSIGQGKYKGADESFDWTNCPAVDPDMWHHLMKESYTALTKAYTSNDDVAFGEAVTKFYK